MKIKEKYKRNIGGECSSLFSPIAVAPTKRKKNMKKEKREEREKKSEKREEKEKVKKKKEMRLSYFDFLL